MGVSLTKVEELAPHLVSLMKTAKVSLTKNGINPDTNKAAVVATIDCSGSAQGLYQSGAIQRVTDMAFAAGLLFDDDGDVPVSLFDNKTRDLGSIELGNCKNFIQNHIGHAGWGGTNYVAALEWIIDQANYSHIDLSNPTTSGGTGFFGKAKTVEGPLTVKAKAPYPMFAMFITDGQPNAGTEDQINSLLIAMSQLPIFVQFIGVGPASFPFLEGLDQLSGRFIDNAGFFDSKKAANQDEMLAGLLNEFPEYYQKARVQGLIT